MKIFGKRIGKFISAILEGKPKTFEFNSDDEAKDALNLMKKSNDGDLESQQKIKETLLIEKEKHVEKLVPEITEMKNSINISEKQIQSKQEIYESNQLIKNLKDHPAFEVIQKDMDIKYFLKGFSAELPMNIVQKFVELISKNQSIEHLILFWEMNLLNDNPEGRRGLYKYLTKQKLIITQEGYFVTFRRLQLVQSKNNIVSSNVPNNIIEEFCAKAKKWRRGKINFEIFYDQKDKQFLLKDSKYYQKHKNDSNLNHAGNLQDIYEHTKIEVEDSKQMYTDAHTRKMAIYLNEPVKMNRSKCNSDSKVECSYGLHVGTPTYVGKNSTLGTIIVACLVNPMHVISVPYSDAHKMRVCEYFPFKILSHQELNNFDNINISVYEQKYKAIEKTKLLEAMKVIDELKPKEKISFSVSQEIVSQEQLEKLIQELEDKKKTLSNKTSQKLSILEDDVNKALNINEVKEIIANRLK
jgi:hypothetical protein